MRPMFNWDTEGERTRKHCHMLFLGLQKRKRLLMGLELIIKCIQGNAICNIEILDMPLLVIPVSHNKIDEKKRKRNEL